MRYLMDEYENHPTQKPEALLKRIISPLPTEATSSSTLFAGRSTTGAEPSPAGENSSVLRSTASASKWGFDGWMSRRITCGRTGESEKKKDRQPVKTKPVKRVDPFHCKVKEV
ncbi:hypothetical protein ACNKHM_15685 [Shigella sonnei]